MRKKRLIAYLIGGSVIVIIFIIAISVFNKAKRHSSSDLTISQVSRRDISATISATGSIKPMVGAEVKVGCRISGKVEHLYANIGDRVENGQVIAEIEKQDLEAQVEEKRAGLTAAQAKLLAIEERQPKEIAIKRTELATAEAKLSALQHQGPKEIAIAQANVSSTRSSLWPTLYGDASTGYNDNRTSEQMQDNSSVGVKLSLPLFSRSSYSNITKAKNEVDLSKTKYEDDSTNLEIAIEQTRTSLELTETEYTNDLKIAQAVVKQAKASLDFALVQLSYAVISAPISGIIASITTQEGENVAAGLSAPTFVTIINLDRLQVDAFVNETDIGKVKVGQDVTFTVDAYSDKEFPGKVIAIYPKAVIQQNVVYYDVVIAINETKGLLRPDMTASVTINAEKRENILTVSNKAIQREEGKRYVYLLENKKAVKKEVVTGWRDNYYTEIVEGLKEGENVVIGDVEPGKVIEKTNLPPGIR
jgi:RND family efflux transporter MFP subunit